MTPKTFVLIHGAGDTGANWAATADALRARGHDVVAPDLPCEVPATWDDYVQAVLDAIGERRGLVVVAHSLGGWTAPLLCAHVPVEQLVLVAAMIPEPGERFGDWWRNSGHAVAPGHEQDDETALFLHDADPATAAAALARGRDQADEPLTTPWPLAQWPAVPTRYLLCRDDRVFPAEWARAHARDRLGIAADEMDGGHMPYVSRPEELAERLHEYATAEQHTRK